MSETNGKFASESSSRIGKSANTSSRHRKRKKQKKPLDCITPSEYAVANGSNYRELSSYLLNQVWKEAFPPVPLAPARSIGLSSTSSAAPLSTAHSPAASPTGSTASSPGRSSTAREHPRPRARSVDLPPRDAPSNISHSNVSTDASDEARAADADDDDVSQARLLL